MFQWNRKNRIRKLADQARQYVESQYVEPKKVESKPLTVESPKTPYDTSIKHSARGESTTQHIQFQTWSMGDGKAGAEATVDDKDNYNSSRIERTMRSISSAPASRVLKELDKSINMTFVDKLLEHISRRHMRDTDVYKAAQVDATPKWRVFWKITLLNLVLWY